MTRRGSCVLPPGDYDVLIFCKAYCFSKSLPAFASPCRYFTVCLLVVVPKMCFGRVNWILDGGPLLGFSKVFHPWSLYVSPMVCLHECLCCFICLRGLQNLWASSPNIISWAVASCIIRKGNSKQKNFRPFNKIFQSTYVTSLSPLKGH